MQDTCIASKGSRKGLKRRTRDFLLQVSSMAAFVFQKISEGVVADYLKFQHDGANCLLQVDVNYQLRGATCHTRFGDW